MSSKTKEIVSVCTLFIYAIKVWMRQKRDEMQILYWNSDSLCIPLHIEMMMIMIIFPEAVRMLHYHHQPSIVCPPKIVYPSHYLNHTHSMMCVYIECSVQTRIESQWLTHTHHMRWLFSVLLIQFQHHSLHCTWQKPLFCMSLSSSPTFPTVDLLISLHKNPIQKRHI